MRRGARGEGIVLSGLAAKLAGAAALIPCTLEHGVPVRSIAPPDTRDLTMARLRWHLARTDGFTLPPGVVGRLSRYRRGSGQSNLLFGLLRLVPGQSPP